MADGDQPDDGNGGEPTGTGSGGSGADASSSDASSSDGSSSDGSGGGGSGGGADPAGATGVSGDDATRRAFDRLEQLLEFPANFPLKVLGQRIDGFESAIAGIVARHVPDFNAASFESRASAKGTYLSLTAVLIIDSREQLENLHRELTAHPWVKVVL